MFLYYNTISYYYNVTKYFVTHITGIPQYRLYGCILHPRAVWCAVRWLHLMKDTEL
jgi:hypothetical protein